MRPRRFLGLAALASVVCLPASCNSVEDFGSYWDKGTIDPALAGIWSRAPDPGTAPDPGSYAVVKTLDAEAVSVLAEIADDPSFWELAAVFRK